MNKYKLGFLGLLLSVSGYSFAYDINDNYDKGLEKIQKTDCAVSLSECRYYAIIEYIAFAKSCGIALSKKFDTKKEKLDEFELQVNKTLEQWKAIDTPELKKAVFNQDNIFRKELTKKIEDYLISSTVDEIGIECSRIGRIEFQQMPEEKSDLLRNSLNFKKWYKNIEEKENKEFIEKQVKLEKQVKERNNTKQ